jgi:hypothetical protein
LLGKANSPYDCGGVDKLGASAERATGITRLPELVDELADELALQQNQLFGLRRFPRNTTRTWRLIFIFVRGHYIREAKVVKGKKLLFILYGNASMPTSPPPIQQPHASAPTALKLTEKEIALCQT